jgi:predicted transcriptional regulator
MIKDVAISTPYEDIFHGANMMAAKGIKRLPIINKGKLKGILSVSDLAPILNKEVERITSFIWSKNLSSKK